MPIESKTSSLNHLDIFFSQVDSSDYVEINKNFR